ncbi:hypothetical protein SAMN05421880_12212 [Nitrosomonas nitrosa]|uniref:Uncharacterized protein n=1 Tax=Nitrosomonas nitrosa TaxID=52442 RepID=A0A1I4S254_9PROT|nr:hypothetical protein [Nitrosomonas nitrosa]SFM58324.1 hypothetical protein SAMN05421880_12212 [Nitrosomonas nitrosa]
MSFSAYPAIVSLSAQISPACFEVFRPMFEFIKSKCPAGAEGGE